MERTIKTADRAIADEKAGRDGRYETLPAPPASVLNSGRFGSKPEGRESLSEDGAPAPSAQRTIATEPPDRRSVVGGLVGAAAYFALLILSLALADIDGRLVSVWLPSGAAVAFLLRMRLANELGFYAAIFTVGVLASGLKGAPFGESSLVSIANMICIAVATGLTRRIVGPRPDMQNVGTLVRFALSGAVIGPLAATLFSVMAAMFATLETVGLESVWDRFLAETLGLLLIVPAALLIDDAVERRLRPDAHTWAEGGALLACSALCLALVFGQDAYWVLFIVAPMTVLHAVRLGSVGVVLHLWLIVLVSTIATWAGHGPIDQMNTSPIVQQRLVQGFIAANFLIGLPIAAILAGRDQRAEAVVQGHQDLWLLANNMTDAVLKLDRNAVCTYASPAVREVLGEHPDALLGRPINNLVQEDAHQRIVEVITRLLDGRSEKERVTYRRRLDGETGAAVFIEADCAIVCDPKTGTKEGVIISARDVTERVELELLLTRARRHAEKAASAKSDFLANMSHEIRTPMNGVLGFTELMLQGELAPKQRRHAEMIVESGRSMMVLLNDILDLSKIEAGQIVIDTGTVDVPAALEECVALHQQAASKKGVSLKIDAEFEPSDSASDREGQSNIANGLPNLTVNTDGQRLRQIALNLIGNAVKFTQVGEVRVSYCARGDDLCVRVQDTGIGINHDRLKTIFLPFTQGNSDIARRYGGTGLGLSISHQLAQLLGGGIAVESTPGVGSVFTLTLPAPRVESASFAPDEKTPVPSKDMPQSARILLVEDHEVNRVLVTEMLERCGQSVDIAQDGNEAISMVMDSLMRTRPYDLILMDVQMPDCDGYQATQAIREEGITADALPIIALTANAFPDDVTAAHEAGMQAHLAKPIEFAQLADVLQRWLPTRIVEAPMDRDVAKNTSKDRSEDESTSSKGDLQRQWLKRRTEVVEEVRRGLGDGLIGFTNKRRANDKADREALVRLIHKLAGTAGSFGEPELGRKAAELQHALANKEPSETCEALAFQLLALADEPSPSESLSQF
ncbi:MAG: ATP-binding protein [Pseudomonadota bacterium]